MSIRPPVLADATISNRLTARDRILLVALSLVLLLPGTYGVSLFDRDEGWYAQVSREMLEGRDWLVPKYLGETWLAKPPLLYWCVAATYRVFGVNELSARLVSVLAMTGAVQLIGTLGARMLNRRAGMIGAISFITAALPLAVGKLVLTDSLLLLGCMGAVVLLWRIATAGSTWGRSLGFWACVGLAAMAKGPAVVLFVGAFAVAMLFGPAKRRWVMGVRFWVASVIAIVIAAPWYVYIARHEASTFGTQFLWFEILSRITGAPHGHGGPPGYYLLLSLAGWLPWTALVPGAVIGAWQCRRQDRSLNVLLIWCVLPWAALELIHSKLPHYIVPCYVPLALLLGWMCDEAWRRPLSGPAPRTERFVLHLWLAVPIALGGAMVAASAYWHHATWSIAAGIAGGALIVGFVAVARLARRNRAPAAWATAVAGISVFYILAGAWVLPGFEPYRLSRLVAEHANAMAEPGAEVFACGYEEPSMFFYLRQPGRLVTTDKLGELVGQAGGPRVLIARDKDWQAAGIAPGTPAARWEHVEGLNYVKMRRETVWLVRCGEDRRTRSVCDSASAPHRFCSRYHRTVAGMPSS